MTLELRLDNYKLVKGFHLDTNAKNNIEIRTTNTNIKLNSWDYTITRGAIYGTYNIKFTIKKANYEWE
jgi:hypothetical protein